MYAIQWKDSNTEKWEVCILDNKAEIYGSREEAEFELSEWQKHGPEAD